MREAVYIGIDVAVKFCVLVVVNAAGQVLHRGRVATTELELQKAVAPWGRRAQVAIEQGELAGWVCRTLAPGVGRIVVAEPKLIKTTPTGGWPVFAVMGPFPTPCGCSPHVPGPPGGPDRRDRSGGGRHGPG